MTIKPVVDKPSGNDEGDKVNVISDEIFLSKLKFPF
jgi:hypothetical protein